MSMKSLTAIAVLSLLSSVPSLAQLAAPNAMGVSIGHVHVNGTNMEAQQRFWAQLGGTLVHNEKIQMVQFPGNVHQSADQPRAAGPLDLLSTILVSM